MTELTGKKSGLCLKKKGRFFIPVFSVFLQNSWKESAYSSEFIVIEEDGSRLVGEIKKAEKRGDALFFSGGPGKNSKWRLEGKVNFRSENVEYMEFRLSLTYSGNREKHVSISVNLDITDRGIPRWLVPAMFYKDNRPEDCVRMYPRYSFTGGDSRKFVSDRWAFCSDRCSFPAVFCWTDRFTTCLAAPESFGKGLTGVEFRGNKEGTRLTLNFPYKEEPVKYNMFNTAPVSEKFTVSKGAKINLTFYLYASRRDLHAYNVFLKSMYENIISKNSLNPWMPKEKACELLSFGLYNWHYDNRHHVIYETCSFDAYFGKKINGKPTYADRTNMHLGWAGGAHCAYALMQYAAKHKKDDYHKAAVNVLDKISTGISPCGAFWSEWTLEKGWGTGWNPDSDWIHSRTVSETSLFMLKAAIDEEKRGEKHANWSASVKKNLDFAVSRQAADGGYGTYYDVNSGDVKEWRGAGGMLWIPALLYGSEYFGNKAYFDSALRAGSYYTRFIDDEYIYGAPEDVHLTPASEDGYNAVITYLALYEKTGDKKWLGYACKSADWAVTFRWMYNTGFAEDTFLRKYDFRTRGGDMASVSNNHIHNYGLVCHPELLRLWEYTGDNYYLQRARDHLLCFHQFIARRDGDFNARKGMISEQWYHNDWWQPKGSMLQLAHSWCAGLIIYADLYTHSYGDIIIDWSRKKIYLLESVEIAGLKTGNDMKFILKNIFQEDIPLKAAIFHAGRKKINVYIDGKKVSVKFENQKQVFFFTLPGGNRRERCTLVIKEK